MGGGCGGEREALADGHLERAALDHGEDPRRHLAQPALREADSHANGRKRNGRG